MPKDPIDTLKIPGWEVRNNHGRITLFDDHPNSRSGICIDVNKKDRTLSIGGWYDTMVGITGGTISIDDLLKLFEPITRK